MASNRQRKKNNNFTGEEQELLMALVRTHKNVIENKKSGQTTWDMKNNTWNQIEQEFNSQSKSMFRDAHSLKTKFRNMKKECKEKFSANKKSMLKTGGGAPEELDIKSTDVEMKDLIGTTVVEGLPSVYDDDWDDETETLNDSQVEEIQVVIDNGSSEEMLNVSKQPLNKKLFVEKDQSSTPIIKTEQKGVKNWSHYTPIMLQGPVDSKLKLKNKANESGITKNRPKRILSCTKAKLYEEVMEAKLDFMQLQKDKFLEEHMIRRKILQMELKLKEAELLNAHISLPNDQD
ncbi:unnamed protein product [Brassicogethes aeneus]|uniref:Regulatory protein zeste n=1 Tax=Brassicogethes aeneus TaxID=1431903 RepID=A0A9P0AMH5_BRAAE|nr:unnamed protein product [Brassicogethes aeneus]